MSKLLRELNCLEYLRFVQVKWTLFVSLQLLSFFALSPCYSQARDPFMIESMKTSEHIRSENIFIKSKITNKQELLSKFKTYDLKLSSLSNIANGFEPIRAIPIPIAENIYKKYIYTEYDFFDPEFEARLLTENGAESISIQKGIQLKGIPEDGKSGFSTLSLFQNEVYGMVYDEEGTKLSILPLKGENANEGRCVFVDEKELNYDRLHSSCQTDDYLQYFESNVALDYRLGDNCKKIGISVDADYDLYLRFNKNIQAVSNYIIGLFNNVHTLYKREGITIMLSQINIHITEDNFSHISASTDLETFRKKYPNSAKQVKLLLSGYQKNNEAPLGGISYINTICNSSYSYAYANVYGSFSNVPFYSWDVFMATHELGHVFSSRHTHACVWGVAKNKAIDNCAKLEGSCASPGIPEKGTLMSYCYLKGMPGIDFLSGFGREPGELIRTTIKNSSCLSSYIPENNTLSTPNVEITANVECNDGVYTHYYFDNNTASPSDDILLLSIDTKGNNIGHIGDSAFTLRLNSTKNYGSGDATQITASYVDRGTQFYVGNKFWTIKTTNPIKTPIIVRYYLNKSDLADLQNIPGSSIMDSVQLFQISEPGNINPETNHENTGKEQFTAYKSNAKPTIGKYTYVLNSNGIYSLDLLTASLANTGYGISIKASVFTKFNAVQLQNSGGRSLVSFSTSYENNVSHFIIQKTRDNIHYDSVGVVKATSQSSTPRSYSLSLSNVVNSEESIRIKAIGPNKTTVYSPSVSITNSYASSNPVSLYPNPVTAGVLFFDYNHVGISETIRIQITDAYGRIETEYSEQALAGPNYYNLNTSKLVNGMHYLSIITKNNTIKKSFSVNQ